MVIMNKQLTIPSGIVGIVNAVLSPYMLNPTAWDWSNYTGFFWGGICFLCIIYTYFRLPEPNGRTFAELGVLFEKGISARKFATTKVDVFHESVDEHVLDELNKADHATVETVEKAVSK
jgi:SP family general alpha glucoside:H+ symporter-like MFS transporter